MADAVHEVLVNLTAEAFTGYISSGFLCIRTGSMIDGSVAGQGTVEQFVCLVDAVSNLGDDGRLAIETGHSDVLVGSDDDGVSLGYFFSGQDVLGTAGAVGFYLDGDAALLGMLFEAFGSHEGVGNTRRAGRNSQYLNVVSFRGCFFCSSCSRSNELAIFLGIDELQELILAFGGNQGFLEVRVHNHGSQLGQDSQMVVIGRVRSSNHEEQAARQAIHGFKIHAGRNRHRGKAGSLYASTLGMGSGDTVAKASGAGCFAGEYIFFVLFFVGQVAAGFHEVSQLIDCGRFVRRGGAQNDAIALEQVSDTHNVLSFYKVIMNNALKAKTQCLNDKGIIINLSLGDGL